MPSVTLTVFFDGQFWVGVFERMDSGKLTVSRVVFGAEPKDQQIHEFVLQNYCYENGRGTYGHGYTFVDSYGTKVFYPNREFGKKWRCWTSRPTDEQRRMEPWK